MAKITTIDDYQQAIVALTVVVEHLREGLIEVKGMLTEHIKGHSATWYWAVPTVLLIVQIIVTLVFLTR